MADEIDRNGLPQATVVRRKRTRVSIVWIIPILAAAVAIGIVVQRVLSEGPTIYIIFKSAQGIEAGKTFIKYKDVNIGLVTAVELSENYGRVVVKAKVAKHASGLMVADAKFWIVEPRISLTGVSGLNTLLSGNYIGFQAGTSTESQRSFIGMDAPPAVTDQKGRTFMLKAPTLGSLGVGSPIYYRQLAVGRVTAFSLTPDGKSVEIGIFIESPYDHYVTTETRFWNASGVEVTLGADGVDVKTESLAALIAGGVAFDIPDFLTPGTEVPVDTAFTLYRTQAVAMKQPDPVERRFVLYFNESVRGLSVGAPVTLYGLPVGEVTGVSLDFDRATLKFRPRVLITFFPERVVAQLSQQQKAGFGKEVSQISGEARLRVLRRIVEEQGLRAQLRTGSLITGEMYVAFEYFPKAPKVKVDTTREPLELPVVPGGLASLEAKLGSILTKIDNMPLDAIGVDVKTAIETLTTTLKDADTLIKRVDVQWVPEGTKTLEALHQAIIDADRMLVNADATLFAKDSPAPQDLRDTLQEVTRAARGVRILVDYLERHPEMLIRGKPEEQVMRRIAASAALCAVVAVAAGCSSTPSRFYTLSPVAPPAAPAVKPSSLSVVVGPVSVPAIVDLPQIVVNTGPNQVSLDEFNRWASPLADNIARVVAQDLVAILGTPRVSLFQQSLNVAGDYRVAIEVQGFESAPGDAATLNAAWSVRRTRDGKSENGRTSVREPTTGSGYDALAGAHSRALDRMSQDIAKAIRALEASPQ